MLKINQTRISKKILILVLVAITGITGFLIYKNNRADQLVNKSAALAEEGYKIMESPQGKRVVMRINGVDVTYGWLACHAKIFEAYRIDSKTPAKTSAEKSAFIDIFDNISMYTEVKKWYQENNQTFTPVSKDEAESFYKMILQLQMNNKKEPGIAGAAQVKSRHIEDDLDYTVRERTINQWTNRNQSQVNKSNAGKYTSSVQQECKEMSKKAYEDATIDYIDKSYADLNKSLIKE